jgi:hypothetical protein
MIGFIRLAAAGAILSCGIAAAYTLPTLKLEAAVAGKLQDRLPDAGAAVATAAIRVGPMALPVGLGSGKGDRLAPSVEACARLTGSSLPTACLARRDGAAPQGVRTVTVETRDAAGTSTLTRVPAITTAQR